MAYAGRSEEVVGGPVTPYQKFAIRFKKLTNDLSEEEVDRILKGGSHGKGFLGWLRAQRIRRVYADKQYYYTHGPVF